MSRSFRFHPARLDASHAGGARDAATAIATRLRRIAGADASGVRVHLDGEVVRLTGRVPQWHVKQLAGSAALAESPNFSVSNDLLVTG